MLLNMISKSRIYLLRVTVETYRSKGAEYDSMIIPEIGRRRGGLSYSTNATVTRYLLGGVTGGEGLAIDINNGLLPRNILIRSFHQSELIH